MTCYAVLGAGRQGEAAAHDLVVHGGATRLLIADSDAHHASEAVRRLHAATGRTVAEAVRLDATDDDALRKVLEPAAAALSALPYWLNPRVARAAVATRTSLADLGGSLASTDEVLALDARAREAGVTLVPDCGLAPGLAATLAAHAVARLDGAESVAIRCGGLPLRPQGPLEYQLVFSASGLVNEYLGEAEVLRAGVVAHVPTLDELEELEFDEPVGRCEAFTTSGGASTLPRTFRGRLRDLDYKTVRYPGHCAKVRLLRDLGLFASEPVQAAGARIPPRAVTEAVLERALSFDEPDLVVLRVAASGHHAGRPSTLTLEILDHADVGTGHSAMQRMTGYPAAMVVALLASGLVEPGAHPVESLPTEPLVSGLAARGIRLTERWA